MNTWQREFADRKIAEMQGAIAEVRDDLKKLQHEVMYNLQKFNLSIEEQRKRVEALGNMRMKLRKSMVETGGEVRKKRISSTPASWLSRTEDTKEPTTPNAWEIKHFTDRLARMSAAMAEVRDGLKILQYEWMREVEVMYNAQKSNLPVEEYEKYEKAIWNMRMKLRKNM